MRNAITDVPCIKVGHAQDTAAGTGCTVILCEKGAVTGVDVRGGAPGTFELDALNPLNSTPLAHAVYLTGGSAFGIAGSAGVMRYLEERGVGFKVGVRDIVVPIVPGAVIFDLPVGNPEIRPDGNMAYQACTNASDGPVAEGNVGAGTGASVGKIAGFENAMKAGLGTASIRTGKLIVGALAVTNALGDIIDSSCGRIVAGCLKPDRSGFGNTIDYIRSAGEKVSYTLTSNTTLCVVGTNADLSKADAARVACMSQTGLSRAINPAHTMSDGDTIFCMATGELPWQRSLLNTIGVLAAEVTVQAILNSVKKADSGYGLTAWKDLPADLKG